MKGHFTITIATLTKYTTLAAGKQRQVWGQLQEYPPCKAADAESGYILKEVQNKFHQTLNNNKETNILKNIEVKKTLDFKFSLT